jgi:tetratricopeptide (TPR) repeat protein
MAMKKRITRKQLLKEPDEFITTTGKLIRVLQTYKTQISYAVGGVFVILIALVGVRYYLTASENQAFSILGQTVVRYDARMSDVGAEKAYQEIQQDFEQLLNKYSGNNGGKIARLTFAGIAYDAGDFDRAIALYKRALVDFEEEPFYEKLIVSSIGHALQGKNDLEAAVGYFNTQVDGADPYLKDEALFHLGELYRTMGDPEKSAAAFRKIISEYPESIYIKMVTEKVQG